MNLNMPNAKNDEWMQRILTYTKLNAQGLLGTIWMMNDIDLMLRRCKKCKTSS